MNIFDMLANATFPDGQQRNLGDEARDRKEWGKAVTLYQRYLETAPEDAGIWVQLGHAYKEESDLKLAEQCYLRALSIELLNPDTHIQLGHIEKLKGNPVQALVWYRKALAISPDFEPAIEECRNVNVGDDIFAASGASPTSLGEPGDDFRTWRGNVMERIEALAASIDALSTKLAEVGELAPIVARHDVLLKGLPGRELVGRLDALTALMDTLNLKVLKAEELERIVSKHDATLQKLPAVVGRLDALTNLVSTLNIGLAEIEKLGDPERKDRVR